MRLHVLSDLHVDADPSFELTLAAGADVLIVAGDVFEGIGHGLAYLRRCVPRPTPIVMIAGNHEYYGRVYAKERLSARKWAADHDITWLDTDAVTFAGVRFIGATLWTDFCYGGSERQARHMELAAAGMNDYRRILSTLEPPRRLSPAETLHDHRLARAFLSAELARPFPGPTVVVTHHGPHPSSIAARFEGDPINAAFVSDLSDLITVHQPTLWVHGHTHTSFDYRLANTRVLCNPKGYRTENPVFDPQLVVDLGALRRAGLTADPADNNHLH
jgi:Icc-related predicted phosphoesterase